MKKVSTEKFWKKVEKRLNAVGSDVLDGSWGLGQSGGRRDAEGWQGARLVQG